MAKQNLRKLIKFSNYSYCVTLPKDFVSRLGWKKGDLLQIKTSASKNKIFLVHEGGGEVLEKTTAKVQSKTPIIKKEKEITLEENSEANLRW